MEAKVEKKDQVIFKKYDQESVLQVPIKIGDLIPEGHLVRIVDQVVDRLDMCVLERCYKSGGCPPYHPKMLIKVWIYGYCGKVYTSRPLAKAMRENIHYIWLSGNQQPCFKTLSEFRGNKMQTLVDVVFKEVLLMLVELGYVDLNDLYTDGSKWEANANRHKVVWRKNTNRHKSVVISRIELLLEEIRALQKAEDIAYGGKDLLEVGEGKNVTVVINSEQVQSQITRLQSLVEEASKQDKEQSGVKSLSRLGSKLELEGLKLKKYEQQEKILGQRNSYSKTDEDATMLRMKDEQLLPGYNVQHSTSNQYIVNYTIAQNASDSPTLIPHLDKMEQRFEGIERPGLMSLGADAGYGSEENYADLEKRGILAYVKYPLWYQEHTGELAKKKFRRENWPFDEKENTYTCPNNRKLYFVGNAIDKSDRGYERKVLVYQCENCDNCPFATECKHSEDKARTVRHSPQTERYKDQARALLASEQGLQVRSNRSVEVEPAFGDIKFNMKHDRLVLREIPKVNVELGLLSIGHNLRKVYCKQSGIWTEQYAQRASRKQKKAKKRA